MLKSKNWSFWSIAVNFVNRTTCKISKYSYVTTFILYLHSDQLSFCDILISFFFSFSFTLISLENEITIFLVFVKISSYIDFYFFYHYLKTIRKRATHLLWFLIIIISVMASAATHDRNGPPVMTDQISTGVSNNLVDALSGLVHHMRSLEHSRRRAEQCFADYAAHSIKIILSDSKSDKAGVSVRLFGFFFYCVQMAWLFSSFLPPSWSYWMQLFKNCSHGILHIRIDVEFCSPVYADTFYCSLYKKYFK